MGMVFDKLAFVKRLEDAGVTRPRAAATSDAFHHALVETVATRQDVNDAKSALREDLAQLRTEMRTAVAQACTELAQMKVWTSGVGVAVVSVLSAIKFFG